MLKKIIFIFLPFLLFALPDTAEVKAGFAKISSQDHQMTIRQDSDKAVIHWKEFFIDKGETVEFKLPFEKASTLNRVVGSNISEIHGSLKSNGALYLVNSNGILIGPTGTVNTHSFIASTYELNDSEYLAYKKISFKESLSKNIVNEGLVTSSHGDIVLVAKEIRNEGCLTAPDGKVSLNAGLEVYLFPEDGMKTTIRVKKEGEISSSGAIKAAEAELKANAGNAYSSAINVSGVIEAHGLSEKAGRVILDAEGNMLSFSGKIFAKYMDNEQELGGDVRILGDLLFLENKSLIDVSAKNGGGQVLVGGDYQGKNPDIKNASFIYAALESGIKADSLEKGNGGKVILWSDNCTEWKGNISCQGGKNGGDGGFIEVSSKGLLSSLGTVDASAPLGKTGIVLFDPYNITISGADANVSWNGGSPNVAHPTATSATINAATLVTNLGLANVIVRTVGGGGMEAGTITVASNVSWSGTNKLSLIATGQILINSGVSIANTNAGGANFDAIELISLGHASGNYAGVYNNGGTITSVWGNIYIQGKGGNSSTYNYGVNNLGTISSTGNTAAEAAKITIVGTGGPGTDYNFGVQNSSAVISSVDGNIHISGTSLGTGVSNAGIKSYASAICYSSDEGEVTLVGYGSKVGTNYNDGIYINPAYNTGGSLYSTNANLNIFAKGGGTGTENNGLRLDQGDTDATRADIFTNGTGNLLLIGIGGEGSSGGNYGVNSNYSGDICALSTGSVKIIAIGGGTGDNNTGFVQAVDAYVYTGSGNLTMICRGSDNPGAVNGNRGFYSYHATVTGVHTVNGNLKLVGYGGNGSGYSNIGVSCDNVCNVYSSGSGSVTVIGVGSSNPGASDVNCGIYNSVSSIYSTDGPLKVIGIGGSGVGNDNMGIFNYNSANIYSSNSSVTLIGIGGEYTYQGAIGIDNYTSSNIYISGGSGDLTLIGYGKGRITGAGGYNYGVLNYNQSKIYNAGTGNVLITGVGGLGDYYSYGVVNDGNASANTQIYATNGRLVIKGTGGGNYPGMYTAVGPNQGIRNYNYAKIYSNGTGYVTLIGKGGYGANSQGLYNHTSALIQTSSGNIDIIGGGGGTGASSHGVYNGNSAQISTTGNGAITIKGQGSFDGTGSIGIYQETIGYIYTSGTGALNMIGVGAGTGQFACGMLFQSESKVYATGSGSVKLVGQGSKTATGNNSVGIYNQGSGGTPTNDKIYSTSGTLTLIGIGGGTAGSSSNWGIINESQASIYSDSGAVYLIGSSGNGTNTNYGIYNYDDGSGNTKIYSNTGTVSLVGKGRGSGTGNNGVLNAGSGFIGATVAGGSTVDIVVTGYGSPTSSASSYGVSNAGTIHAEGGDLNVRGIGGPGASGISNSGTIDSASGTATQKAIDG